MGFLSSAWDMGIREQTGKHFMVANERAGGYERARTLGGRASSGKQASVNRGPGAHARSLGDGDKAEDIQRRRAFSRPGRIGTR